MVGVVLGLGTSDPSEPHRWREGYLLARRLGDASSLQAAVTTLSGPPSLDDLRRVDPGLTNLLRRADGAWVVRPGPTAGWPLDVAPIGTNDCPERFEVGLDGTVLRLPRR